MKKYMIVKNKELDRLEIEVNEAMCDGWVPSGNLVVLERNDNFYYRLYCQPMIHEVYDKCCTGPR